MHTHTHTHTRARARARIHLLNIGLNLKVHESASFKLDEFIKAISSVVCFHFEWPWASLRVTGHKKFHTSDR